MAFVVRRLAPADAALFRTLRLRALQEAPDAFGASYAEEADRPAAEWAAHLTSSAVFCVFADDEAVGMAGLHRMGRDKVRHRAELWGMFVDTAWRGTPAADTLIQALLDHADGQVAQVELNVEAGNERAVCFYRRHGFVVCGRLPSAVRCADGYRDELIMVRR